MIKLKTTVNLILILFITLSCNSTTKSDSTSQTKVQVTRERIPFTAEPYYYYYPLTINIGKYRHELLAEDATTILKLADRIKIDINNTDVESLYFLSIRLYDLGKKDEAFYWFQTAKARARVFINMLDPNQMGSIGDKGFELKQLFITINELVGEYINGYGFNDIDKGLAVIEKVKSEVKNIQSYKEIYTDIRFLDDTNLEKVKADKEKELAKTIKYIAENKKELKKQREENGIQNKY